MTSIIIDVVIIIAGIAFFWVIGFVTGYLVRFLRYRKQYSTFTIYEKILDRSKTLVDEEMAKIPEIMVKPSFDERMAMQDRYTKSMIEFYKEIMG